MHNSLWFRSVFLVIVTTSLGMFQMNLGPLRAIYENIENDTRIMNVENIEESSLLRQRIGLLDNDQKSMHGLDNNFIPNQQIEISEKGVLLPVGLNVEVVLDDEKFGEVVRNRTRKTLPAYKVFLLKTLISVKKAVDFMNKNKIFTIIMTSMDAIFVFFLVKKYIWQRLIR